jgi:AcrR family transcriptional regulator
MDRTKKNLPAEKRRALTVETMISLAGEQNPSEITTAAIAQRMGLTQGAIFRHFPSKDAILQAAMDWVAQRLISRSEEATSAAGSPLASLEGLFLFHAEFIASHPGIPRMLFGELQHPEDRIPKRMAQAIMARYKESLRTLLHRGRECGELDEGLDVEAAATLFIGALQGLVVQSMIAGDGSRVRHDAPLIFALYRRGLRRMA